MNNSSLGRSPNAERNTVTESIFGIIFTLLFLYLVNAFYDDISFITTDFEKILDLYNFALILSIVLYGFRIFFPNLLFKAITEIINAIVMIVIAYFFWTIFPFDTSKIGNQDFWNLVFRFFIIVPTFGVTIAAVVELIKLGSEKNSNQAELKD